MIQNYKLLRNNKNAGTKEEEGRAILKWKNIQGWVEVQEHANSLEPKFKKRKFK